MEVPANHQQRKLKFYLHKIVLCLKQIISLILCMEIFYSESLALIPSAVTQIASDARHEKKKEKKHQLFFLRDGSMGCISLHICKVMTNTTCY